MLPKKTAVNSAFFIVAFREWANDYLPSHRSPCATRELGKANDRKPLF